REEDRDQRGERKNDIGTSVGFGVSTGTRSGASAAGCPAKSSHALGRPTDMDSDCRRALGRLSSIAGWVRSAGITLRKPRDHCKQKIKIFGKFARIRTFWVSRDAYDALPAAFIDHADDGHLRTFCCPMTTHRSHDERGKVPDARSSRSV